MRAQSAKLYPATHLFFLSLRALLFAKIGAAETKGDITFYHRKLRGSTYATDNREYEDIHRTKYQASPHVYRTVTDNYERRRVLLANSINETESGGFTNNNSNTSDAKPSEPKKIPVPLPLMPKKTPSPTLQPSPAAALLDSGAGTAGSAPSAGDDPSAAGGDSLPTDSSGDSTESNSNGSSSGSNSSSSSGSEDDAASKAASVDPADSNIGQRGRVYPLLVAFVGIVFLAACVCYPLLRRQQQQTIAISNSGSAKNSSAAAATAWSTQQQQQKYAPVPHEDGDTDKDGDFEMHSALVRRSSSRSPMFPGLEGGGGRGGQVGKDVNHEISSALRFNADSDNHHDYGDGGAHNVPRAKSMDSSIGAGLRININPLSASSAATGKTIARGFSTDADDLFESIGIAATPTFRPASRQPTPKSSAGSPSRLTVVAGGSEKATNSRRNIFGERAQQGTTIGTGGTADNIKVNVNVRGLSGDAIHTERESGKESGTGLGVRSIDEMSEKLALELRQLDDSENFKVVGSSSGPLAPSGSAARFAQRMGLVGAGSAATSSAVALGLASSGSTATTTAAAAAGEGIRSAAAWEEEGGGGVDDDDDELNELLASDRDT